MSFTQEKRVRPPGWPMRETALLIAVKYKITNEFCKDYLGRKGLWALLGYKYLNTWAQKALLGLVCWDCTSLSQQLHGHFHRRLSLLKT